MEITTPHFAQIDDQKWTAVVPTCKPRNAAPFLKPTKHSISGNRKERVLGSAGPRQWAGGAHQTGRTHESLLKMSREAGDTWEKPRRPH